MEKYRRAVQATDENMARAHCMLDKQRLRQSITALFLLLFVYLVS
jgi:hypothetical protein